MKVLVWLVIIVIVGGISVQLYHLYQGNNEADNKLEQLLSEQQRLTKERDQLQADLDYYSQPENLAKELKAKFDYKRPGEKLIKIQ